MRALFFLFLEITLSVSLMAAVLVLAGPRLNRRYAAGWKCWIWAFLALRLLVPWNGSIADFRTAISASVQFWENIGQGLSGMSGNSDVTGSHMSGLTEPDGALSGLNLSDPVQIEIPLRMTVPIFDGYRNERNADAGYAGERDWKGKYGIENNGIAIIDIIALIWIAGGAISILANVWVYRRFQRRLRKKGIPVKDEDFLRRLKELREELGIRREIPAVVFPEAAGPMVTGFVRPLLLLPEGGVCRDDLPFILRHELTHLKSGHMYLKLLLLGAKSLHWFNPFIGLMLREASVDMELACDESVVRGRDYAFRRAYSETLLSAMQKQCSRRFALSTQFYGGKNMMKKRFRQILKKTKEKNGMFLLAATILLTVCMGALVGCSETAFPIDYGHEVRADVDGDGKAERILVTDNREGDMAYTQLTARFDNGRVVFINFEGYFASFLVTGDLSGNGRADVVLVRADTGSTFGAVEVSVLYFEEDRWVEYPYLLTANEEIDLYQPEKIYSEDGFGDSYIGATIVREQDETCLRLITPVDIINAETVECVDVAWEGEHWQIRDARLVENYYTERRAAELLENTYDYGVAENAGSADAGASDGEMNDEELCRLALSYYEARHDGHIPQVAVVDSVAPDGRVVIHLYDNAEGHSVTCDWYTVDRRTGVGEDVLLEEVRLLE